MRNIVLRPYNSLFEVKKVDGIDFPEINDEILMGKWKNKKAIVKGFDVDEKGQPIVLTSKGKHNLYKFRIPSLMPPKVKKDPKEPKTQSRELLSEYPGLFEDFDNTDLSQEIIRLANKVESKYRGDHRELNMGNCGSFALALYKHFGAGEVVVLSQITKPDSYVHCVYKAEDGNLYDFEGRRPLDSMLSMYGVNKEDLFVRGNFQDKEEEILKGTNDTISVDQMLQSFQGDAHITDKQ